METSTELKQRIEKRLRYRIKHPSGIFRNKLLKDKAYKIGAEYTDKLLPEKFIESILQLEDGEEKERKFDQLCESIVKDLVEFKRHIEDNARSGEIWHDKYNINNFLIWKGD